MRIHFIRHGQSTANLLGEFANRDDGHPLTQTGIEQAREAASLLANRHVVRIYSSPLLRARQTAETIGTSVALNLSPVITESLREWDVGVYEGTTDPHGWELHAQVQQEWWRGNIQARMPGGEDLLMIRRRFRPLIDELVDSPPTGDVVCVGHGGLYLAMLPEILENIERDTALRCGFPNASDVVARVSEGRLYCLSWGDQSI